MDDLDPKERRTMLLGMGIVCIRKILLSDPQWFITTFGEDNKVLAQKAVDDLEGRVMEIFQIIN